MVSYHPVMPNCRCCYLDSRLFYIKCLKSRVTRSGQHRKYKTRLTVYPITALYISTDYQKQKARDYGLCNTETLLYLKYDLGRYINIYIFPNHRSRIKKLYLQNPQYKEPVHLLYQYRFFLQV